MPHNTYNLSSQTKPSTTYYISGVLANPLDEDDFKSYSQENIEDVPDIIMDADRDRIKRDVLPLPDFTKDVKIEQEDQLQTHKAPQTQMVMQLDIFKFNAFYVRISLRSVLYFKFLAQHELTCSKSTKEIL